MYGLSAFEAAQSGSPHFFSKGPRLNGHSCAQHVPEFAGLSSTAPRDSSDSRELRDPLEPMTVAFAEVRQQKARIP